MATQADIARHLGRKRSQISAWVKKGMPVTSLEEAERWVARSIRGRQRAGNGPATVAAPSADPVIPHDETLPGLQKRRLAAEVVILEHKAKTGSGTRLGAAGTERALRMFYTMGRASVDATHPKLLERLDEFCPEAHPGYHALYSDTFRLLRESWVGVWMELVKAMLREHPAWAEKFFPAFAAGERGPETEVAK